jgi:hypothetical protein
MPHEGFTGNEACAQAPPNRLAVRIHDNPTLEGFLQAALLSRWSVCPVRKHVHVLCPPRYHMCCR